MSTATVTMADSMPAKVPINTSSYSGRIASAIRSRREECDLTVKELAERIRGILPKGMDLANSTLHGWDNGSRKIDTDYLPFIAKALAVKLPDLLPKK